jgi:ElaB/YqjD/DUF883 family membrane-anchored ribosome-binding protein
MRHKTGNGHDINVEQFVEDLKTVVRDGEELLKAGANGLKDRAVSGAHSTDQMVRSHPYQTLGLVFGLGLIAGLLASGPFGRRFAREED